MIVGFVAADIAGLLHPVALIEKCRTRISDGSVRREGLRRSLRILYEVAYLGGTKPVYPYLYCCALAASGREHSPGGDSLHQHHRPHPHVSAALQAAVIGAAREVA